MRLTMLDVREAMASVLDARSIADVLAATDAITARADLRAAAAS